MEQAKDYIAVEGQPIDLISRALVMTSLDSKLAVSSVPYDWTINTTKSRSIEDIIREVNPINLLFSCPNCGNHFIARDPGFVPNCQNCGTVLRLDKLDKEEK